MEHLPEAKQLIRDAKNIYVIPSQEPEILASAMALFYTLKESDKNVNLIIDSLPENLKFLSPTLDFISYPKNFVISVPNRIAKISQLYYESNEEDLKIHLTLENGIIKKDDISFYFSEAKPDLIITMGVRDYQKELSGKLNSFGFILDSTILNIDNNEQENKKFGKINLIGNESISEIIFDLMDNGSIKEKSAVCLLSGLIIHTGNFKNKITANIFEKAGYLMKKGADFQEITESLGANN
jgi:nanoRNase/pAp phosphatase (c-di-AMP/oligoRNAs hydrolase)